MSTKKGKYSKFDKKCMQLAMKLASSRNGITGRNPSVGCVIAKKNKILSIGITGIGGKPHAEHMAIQNSNSDIRASKMYISMEPCNHRGKTGPCTTKIIKKKIKEVFYPIEDEDNRVKGKSFYLLKSKKIIVRKGLYKNKAKLLYESYFFNKKNKKPFVTGKIAISKNNQIYSKKKRKITNKISDNFTHFLRYKNDSIMISHKTLNTDNPKLNCRIESLENFSPRRIILDKDLDTNVNSFIFKTSNKFNTVIFHNTNIKKKVFRFKKKGITLIKSPVNNKGHFDLNKILKKLYILGCRNLLVEGGNELTSSFIKNKMFNKFYLFKSKKIFLYNNDDRFKFKCNKNLNQKYKKKFKISKKNNNDLILLYRN